MCVFKKDLFLTIIFWKPYLTMQEILWIRNQKFIHLLNNSQIFPIKFNKRVQLSKKHKNQANTQKKITNKQKVNIFLMMNLALKMKKVAF